MAITGTSVSGGTTSGDYIDRQDVENVFGDYNVKRWSQLDPDVDAADTNRIQAAIDHAEQIVESRYRDGKYTIPFSGTDLPIIKDWMAKLAGVWLYMSRGFEDSQDATGEAARMTNIKKSVHQEIARDQREGSKMDLDKRHAGKPTAPQVLR